MVTPLIINLSSFSSSAFSTEDVSAEAEELDYEAVNSQTVTFPANSDTAPATVTILSDSSTEYPETFVVSIAHQSNGNLCAMPTAMVTIYDQVNSRE